MTRDVQPDRQPLPPRGDRSQGDLQRAADGPGASRAAPTNIAGDLVAARREGCSPPLRRWTSSASAPHSSTGPTGASRRRVRCQISWPVASTTRSPSAGAYRTYPRHPRPRHRLRRAQARHMTPQLSTSRCRSTRRPRSGRAAPASRRAATCHSRRRRRQRDAARSRRALRHARRRATPFRRRRRDDRRGRAVCAGRPGVRGRSVRRRVRRRRGAEACQVPEGPTGCCCAPTTARGRAWSMRLP